jgi:hypothetical protein
VEVSAKRVRRSFVSDPACSVVCSLGRSARRQHGVRSVPDRGRSIVFLAGDEGQLIAPARRPHQGGDRDKNGGRHDAGGHETAWRRAECGIEPAAVAKAKLRLRSYFLRMRRNTYGLAHGLRDRFMDRRHTLLHSRLRHRREGGSRRVDGTRSSCKVSDEKPGRSLPRLLEEISRIDCSSCRGTNSSNPSPSSRQSVSRGFSPSCVEKPAVAAACAGSPRRRSRQRRARLVIITPTAGNISVGPYSSTAVPARRFVIVVALVYQVRSG